MNATRAITIRGRSSGYNRTFSVGRVRTPTLALVVKREEEIKKFKSIDYYNVAVPCQCDEGFFTARLAVGKLPPDKQHALDGESRLIDEGVANTIAASTSNKIATFIGGQTQEKTEPPPLPYSLSALQVQASKQYAMKAQGVLDTCQALYDRKLITYPRAASTHLPLSQFDDRQTIINNLRGLGSPLKNWAAGTDGTLKSRAWNDEKISAHHAIIPTLLSCNWEKMGADEQKIYTLVAQNYLAQFYPAYRYESIQAEITAAGYVFAVNGKNVLADGWKVLYAKNAEETDEQSAPKLTESSNIHMHKATVKKEKTTAPPRYTEGTLLAAMTAIHRHVHNAELRETLKETGLGTEATRAGILKSLVDENYLYEEGKKKYLVPTQEAYLLTALPAQLIYPDFTALMERELELIAENKIAGAAVLEKNAQMIQNLCEALKCLSFPFPENRACPLCKSALVQRTDSKGNKFWGCSKYPECKAAFPDKNGEPDLTPKEAISCPVCQQGTLRLNKKLNFWGCNKFPECKATFQDKNGKPQIILCPQCKKGYLKRSEKDKKRWYCSGYKEGCSASYEDNKGRPKIKS
jgi:DNA topoisomerase-3